MNPRDIRTKPLLISLFALALGSAACGGGTSTGNPLTEDDSPSGAVAAAIGGALSGSNSGGTQALASTWELASGAVAGTCPTFRSASGSGCSTSAGTMWLAYAACSFGGTLSWTGTQALISSASASCGTFPNPGASGNLVRQFVASAGSTTPATATVTAASGATVTIDDASANAGNFDNATLAALANGGYGVRVDFGAGGGRSAITIRHRVYSSVFDHTISGQLSVSEASGASSRSISGTIKVYHNGVRVVGTSVLSELTHSDSCCLPTAGSITTTFERGDNVSPRVLGLALVGKSEKLTFTGCGTATRVDADGVTTEVALNRCY